MKADNYCKPFTTFLFLVTGAKNNRFNIYMSFQFMASHILHASRDEDWLLNVIL